MDTIWEAAKLIAEHIDKLRRDVCISLDDLTSAIRDLKEQENEQERNS